MNSSFFLSFSFSFSFSFSCYFSFLFFCVSSLFPMNSSFFFSFSCYFYFYFYFIFIFYFFVCLPSFPLLCCNARAHCNVVVLTQSKWTLFFFFFFFCLCGDRYKMNNAEDPNCELARQAQILKSQRTGGLCTAICCHTDVSESLPVPWRSSGAQPTNHAGFPPSSNPRP